MGSTFPAKTRASVVVVGRTETSKTLIPFLLPVFPTDGASEVVPPEIFEEIKKFSLTWR